ncbi:hypothetical protein ANO11243_095910 [Dothideomycetidae sp. 11243]|nr:hypothetical protein ANO11243_095910 [fungal sp. No.11243]
MAEPGAHSLGRMWTPADINLIEALPILYRRNSHHLSSTRRQRSTRWASRSCAHGPVAWVVYVAVDVDVAVAVAVAEEQAAASDSAQALDAASAGLAAAAASAVGAGMSKRVSGSNLLCQCVLSDRKLPRRTRSLTDSAQHIGAF